MNYRKGKYTEQQNSSGTWTAGIDAMRHYSYQDKQWHLHAIEFHHKDKIEAEKLRDLVFKFLEKHK